MFLWGTYTIQAVFEVGLLCLEVEPVLMRVILQPVVGFAVVEYVVEKNEKEVVAVE
jgi:hypothetical protein